MKRKLLLAALAVSSIGVIPLTASAAVYVDVAPPAPRHEVIPHERHGYVWAPGYWDRRGHEWVWVRGHWERERHGMYWHPQRWVERDGRWVREGGRWDRERPGYLYAPARWVERDGRWYYTQPGWGRRHDSDGDGIPDRYDRAPYDPRYR